MPIIGRDGCVTDNTQSEAELKVSAKSMASFLEEAVEFDRKAGKADRKTGDFLRIALNPVCLGLDMFLRSGFKCFISEKKIVHPDFGYDLGILIGRKADPEKFHGGETILYSTHGCSGVEPGIYLAEGFHVLFSPLGEIERAVYSFMGNRDGISFHDVEERVRVPDFCMKKDCIAKLTPEQRKELDETVKSVVC